MQSFSFKKPFKLFWERENCEQLKFHLFCERARRVRACCFIHLFIYHQPSSDSLFCLRLSIFHCSQGTTESVLQLISFASQIYDCLFDFPNGCARKQRPNLLIKINIDVCCHSVKLKKFSCYDLLCCRTKTNRNSI